MSGVKLVRNLSLRHGCDTPSTTSDDHSESLTLDDPSDDVFIPRNIKNTAQIAGKRGADRKTLVDVNKFISFDLNDENDENNLTPINISNYFCDDASPHTVPSISVDDRSFKKDISQGALDSTYTNNRLNLPTHSDGELTDAECSDSEKERQYRKQRLNDELLEIGSGFTSAYGFYKVEDEVENDSYDKRERSIGKVNVPRLFDVVQEVQEVHQEMKRNRPDDVERTIEVDDRFKEEAAKYGKYVLPGPDDYEDMVFDKIFIPCTNLDVEQVKENTPTSQIR